MSKTFRRNSQFRPKKQGRIFTKDQSWKKRKKQSDNIILPQLEQIEGVEYPNIEEKI
jgi:hypothetical protein